MTDCNLRPYAYSVAKLARLWDCSTRHVYELCAKGDLGHFRIGSIIRITDADRQAYEARNCHAPDLNSPTTDSSNVVPLSTSGGGKVGNGSAFQRGRETVAKRIST
jgi:hypothetical protein